MGLCPSRVAADTADVVVGQSERLDGFFAELAELAGQRNAIDGRIAEIAAEIDEARLWGFTGVKSMEGLIAWRLGTSMRNAETIVAVARRMAEFPRCVRDLREGRLSLDQVGAIAEGAGTGSDAHYAELASHSTVTQLRTAIKQELARTRTFARTDPDAELDDDAEPVAESVPQPSISKRRGGGVHLLADPAAGPRSGDLRRGAAVAPGRADRPMATRPPRPPPTTDRPRSQVRGGRRCRPGGMRSWRWCTRAGMSRPPAPAWAAHHGGGACRCQRQGRRAASGAGAVGRAAPVSGL